MNAFEFFALLLGIAACFAYINHRWIKIPAAIGLMGLSLVMSLALIVLDRLFGVGISLWAAAQIGSVPFGEVLLHNMLGALLFAGALHVDLNDLKEQRLAVTGLALGSTLISTALVGVLIHVVFGLLGTELPLAYCFLFGALISPTDPIAVMGILRAAKVPKRLEVQIAGESLFNDGIGVVLFLTVLSVIKQGTFSPGTTIQLFLQEAIGGVLFGLFSGYIVFYLLRSIDHYQTELLITIALVTGGYALAEKLHVSAAIAAVVSGLLIGNQGRTLAMSDTTREHLDKFWMLVDEVLNAILFVFMGLEIVSLHTSWTLFTLSVVAIGVVLIARFISVVVPVTIIDRITTVEKGASAILTWGGLRGGISVALALSLPDTISLELRTLLVTVTYGVVVFSVLVQGLTLGAFTRKLVADRGGQAERSVEHHLRFNQFSQG